MTRRLALVGALFVLGAIAGLLSGCGGCRGCSPPPAAPPPPPPPPVKFLALNAANGNGDAYRTPAARAAQRRLIADQAPDVVALQEVDRGTARVGGVDTDAEILPPGGTTVFAKEGNVAGGGACGNSLWLHPGLEILDQWVVDLDRGAWVGEHFVSDTWPRASACAKWVDEVGRVMSACDVHLTAAATREDGSPAPSDAIRQRQIDETAGFDPDVVLGDFNALTRELAGQMADLGYAPVTRGEEVAVWWRLRGSGWMVPAHDASDHPGAAVAVTDSESEDK